MNEYILHVIILVLIYIILAVSLDLIAGHTGLLSVAHGAFFGVGAYSSALLSVHFQVQFLAGTVVGMVIAAALSTTLSAPSFRLRGDYFLLLTFGFQVLIFNVLNNWESVTRGALGIPNVAAPRIFGWAVDSKPAFVVVCLLFASVSYILVQQLVGSPFGRVIHAIREDELLAQSLGKDVLRYKVSVFALSSALAASAGSLYVHYVTYVAPGSFTVMDSISMISMVIVGGAGSRWGPLVGPALLVTTPEILRVVGLTTAGAANVRQILYGVLLVIMMIWRPQGIIGRYTFER